MSEFKTEYRVIGTSQYTGKAIVLAGVPLTGGRIHSLSEAQRALERIKAENERDIKRGKIVTSSGCIGIECEVDERHRLLDLKIQCRQVTPWKDFSEIGT